MRFGDFDDQNREYVISRPDTPLPWINYLGNQDFFGLISNTAGGYTFYKDARLRRLTRYRYNNTPLDVGGRYLYLRDEDRGEFWSPTWMPTRTTLDDYECRHGMGYTKIHSKYQGIQTQVRYFIPQDENLEIWELTLHNQREDMANLSIFSVVEFCLWDAWDDATNYQRNFNIGEVEVPALEAGTKTSRSLRSTIFHKTEYRERRNHFAYFSCSEAVKGFDTQREAFLGNYRGWDDPFVVETGQATNSVAHGWQPIGSHHVQLELAPGEQRKIIFLLGYQENEQAAKFDPPGSQDINKKKVIPLIEHYLDPQHVEEAFQDLKNYWDGQLSKFQVETPDEHTNRMVNIWNAYQVMVTFNLSRSASYFESGIGRGMGFRDSNQDLLGFMHMIPERGRARLLDLAATQLPSGGAYHQYQPLTKRGNNDIGGGFNDDPLWLILAASAYLKETGDWDILKEPVPFDNQPGTEEPFYDHLDRSIQYTLTRLGPHGLPLIGRADWNDCLNLNCFSDTPGQSFQTTTNSDGKVAESLFIAGLFILAACEMAGIADRLRYEEQSKGFKEAAQSMEKAIWSAGWDGEWFRRAYDDSGSPVGSKTCQEGQIYIEPQGMCVMAGLGLEDGRARQALDSVATRLATPHGILLLQPTYTRYYLHLGEISSYPPGYKENGSVFCHNNPWVMIAETRIGRGDQAHDYYLRINPSWREELSDLHICEPYVYAQTIAGRDAALPGEAKNSWLTGAAAWNYVAITQWILGIRPDFDGLRLDPCIPAGWNEFSAMRKFRDHTYAIRVHNPQGVCQGVVRMRVDGVDLRGNLIPPDLPGLEHQVEAWLGK